MIGLLLAATIELHVADYIGKPPSRLGGILGKVKRRSNNCPDAEGGRQTEYEHGWICTVGGRVVIFEYDLAHDAASPEEALARVGLQMNSPSRALAGNSNIWSVSLGNPVIVNGKPATRVIAVLSGGTRGVIVDVGPH